MNTQYDAFAEMSEAQVKKHIDDRLKYYQSQNKLYFSRMNAGVVFTERRRVRLGQKGVSDYIVFMNCFAFPKIQRVIFLEIKSAKGKQSPGQADFQALITKMGYEYCIIHNIKELESLLNLDI